MFGYEFGGKALGQTVYLVSIDWDQTMRSSRVPEGVFVSKERAQQYVDSLHAKYKGATIDFEITKWKVK